MNTSILALPLLQAAQGNATGQLVTTVVTFGLVILIFYFLIIRPQSKKRKETNKMRGRREGNDFDDSLIVRQRGSV